MGWIENNYDSKIINDNNINFIITKKTGTMKTGKNPLLSKLLSKKKLFEQFDIKELNKSKMSGSSNSVTFGKANNMNVAIRSSIDPIALKTYSDVYGNKNELELSKHEYLLKRTRNAWKFANDNGLCPKILFFGYYYVHIEQIKQYQIYSCIISEQYDGSMFDYNQIKSKCNTERICDQLTQQIIDLLNKMTNGGYICYDIKPENTVYKITEEDTKIGSDVRLIDWDGDFCINHKSAKDYNLILRLIMASHFKRFNSNLFNNNVFKEHELDALYSGIDDFITDTALRKIHVENYFPELKSEYNRSIKDGTDILNNKEGELKIFLLKQLKEFTPEGYKCGKKFINVKSDCTPKEDEIRTSKIIKKKKIFKRFFGKGGNRSTKKKSKSKKTKTRKCQ
jgi:hypothetical protein